MIGARGVASGFMNIDPLVCPACGNGYLHHEGVTVYERKEDAEKTMVTSVGWGSTTVRAQPSKETRNPSDRRGGIAILFWCEQCPSRHELTIAQHKGMTYVNWRPVEGESIHKIMDECH